MRLIDADNLYFEGQYYNKSQMKAILDFVDNQPTAYELDDRDCPKCGCQNSKGKRMLKTEREN